MFKAFIGFIILMDLGFVAANLYEYVAAGHHWYSLAAAVICGLGAIFVAVIGIEAWTEGH